MRDEGLLRCTIGRYDFAIRAGELRHVARADQMRRDESADGRAGSVKLGGQDVPVFCLGQVLGLPGPDAASSDQHLAVTGDHDALVGWLVDRVTRESRGTAATVAPLPASVGGHARQWFDGVAINDDDVMLVINPRRLNPLRRATDVDEDMTPAFAAPPRLDHQRAEPVALVFSTPALPPSGVDKFALSARQVAAIVQPTDPIVVPGCAANIAGLTLWRDVVVPIIDLMSDRADGPNRRRLIARNERSLIAMAIDADVLMHRPAADNKMLIGVSCPSFASGVFELHGERVALLDLDAVVA